MLVNSEVQSINEAWDKLIGLAGVRPSSFKMGDFLAVDGVVTTSDIAFYVNPTTGNDDLNDGSITRPFKTLAKAAQEVPLVQAHNVTINMSAGTHEVIGELKIGGMQISQDIDFKIQGADFVSATPISGARTGTFTSAADWTLTMTGAGWTASDLVGKFVKITSGSLNGEFFPIAGNTATAIEVPRKTVTSAATATFEIMEPSTVLSFASTDACMTISTLPVMRQATYTTTTTTHGTGPIFDSIKFISPTSTEQSIIRGSATSSFVLNKCYAKAKDEYSTVYSAGGHMSIAKSYIASKSTSATNVRAIWQYTTATGYVFARDMVIDGMSSSGGFGYGIYSASRLGISINDCIVQGYTGSNGSGCYVADATIGSTWVKNCLNGITFSSGMSKSSLNNTKVSNVTGVGIECTAHSCSITSLVTVIDSCTSHGIKMWGAYSLFLCGSALTVTNCGGFGITTANPSFPKVGVYNSTRIVTATMSGNTSGDMTIDGTTPISYATLAADPDKTIVDSVTFNRISLD